MKRFRYGILLGLILASLSTLVAQSPGVGTFSRLILKDATTNGPNIRWGSGNPNGVSTSPMGSLYLRTNGSGYLNTDGGTTWALIGSGGGVGDFSSNTSTSVDSEVVIFSGTTGKLGKRASATGLAKLTAGVLSAYPGDSCTNQFPRSINASGIWTCAAVANADLAGSIAASKLVGTDIATVGTITSGTWTGTDIAFANIAAASAASRLLGRGSVAGAGDFQEITLGSGLSFTGTVLSATGSGGTVTSVAQSFTGGLISVGGSPITGSGTLALTVAGTSGGVPYFDSASTWASSGALTANLPVIGGGAGAAPTVGTRSGNTTAFVTTTGSLTSGDCVKIDANGNFIANGSACGGAGGAALSAITAATGANTIASGNNRSQIWNWALTSTGDAHTFGETTAATGGNSTGNQSILKAATLSTSTAVPFVVDNFGAGYSVRINDVSGDTTPFSIAADGSVGVMKTPQTNKVLYLGTNGTFTTFELEDDTSAKMGNSRMAWGTTTNTPLTLMANGTGFVRLSTTALPYMGLGMSGTPSTSITATSQRLQIGLSEDANNGYFTIGFGYNNNNNNGDAGISPGVIGCRESTNAGNTYCDLVFMTRNVTSNTAPSTRLRIDREGSSIWESTSPTPAVSNTSANSCGTTAAAIAGNNHIGKITVGATAGTSCTLTFATTAPVEWICFGTNRSTPANIVAGIPVSTTTAKLDGTFVAGDVLSYSCEAR